MTTQSQATTSSSLSDQARLINPSPGIVTLLPSVALEHHCSPDFFPPAIPGATKLGLARPRGLVQTYNCACDTTSRPEWPLDWRNTMHVFVNQLTREFSYTLYHYCSSLLCLSPSTLNSYVSLHNNPQATDQGVRWAICRLGEDNPR